MNITDIVILVLFFLGIYAAMKISLKIVAAAIKSIAAPTK